MRLSNYKFGETACGQIVEGYGLERDGVQLELMTYGATVTSLKLPVQGELRDIVLGFDTFAEYEQQSPYFGATVGRYANRIAKGSFELDGQHYQLAQNDGTNHLHGGVKGFDKVIWEVKETSDTSLTLAYKSPDGEEGYPGAVEAQVRYSLLPNKTLGIDYSARTDRPTIVNLTHHSYFNLATEGDCLGHELMLNADHFLPVDEALIPTGELRKVEKTAFDFRTPTLIGARLGTKDVQLEHAGGYDHSWCLIKEEAGALTLAARVLEPRSGLGLELYTDQAGVQFYSGTMLPALKGKGGQTYAKYSGFCLEPHIYPDAPNQPSFPKPILRPGEVYQHSSVFKFPGSD